jgi:hypothetical protein
MKGRGHGSPVRVCLQTVHERYNSNDSLPKPRFPMKSSLTISLLPLLAPAMPAQRPWQEITWTR